MNRRDFFRAAGALAAMGLVPARTNWHGDAYTHAVASLRRVAAENATLDSYVAFLRPDCLADLLAVEARWRWQAAWRAYREARRGGLEQRELDPQRVLDGYGLTPALPRGQIGAFEGLRFITSEPVA